MSLIWPSLQWGRTQWNSRKSCNGHPRGRARVVTRSCMPTMISQVMMMMIPSAMQMFGNRVWVNGSMMHTWPTCINTLTVVTHWIRIPISVQHMQRTVYLDSFITIVSFVLSNRFRLYYIYCKCKIEYYVIFCDIQTFWHQTSNQFHQFSLTYDSFRFWWRWQRLPICWWAAFTDAGWRWKKPWWFRACQWVRNTHMEFLVHPTHYVSTRNLVGYHILDGLANVPQANKLEIQCIHRYPA